MTNMQNNIMSGLELVDKTKNWLELYENWSNAENNQFSSILIITDPFNTKCVGDSNTFDETDEGHMIDLDIMKMSVFLSEQLRELTCDTFLQVKNERNREKKKCLITNYFNLVDGIASNQELSGCIVALEKLGGKQLVLKGNRAVDVYALYYSLRENLRKSSVESIYLQFTLWRLTQNEKDLDKLIISVVNYIRDYYEEFGKDPDMHLDYPLDRLPAVKKLAIIEYWLERISFHTNGIFEKYKELEWLRPKDLMADEIIATNQISKYEMLQYAALFDNDDKDTVIKKAICYHGYFIWIKTVDVMYIVCDVFQVLYYADDRLINMDTTKSAILEQYDNMVKIRDYYTRKVFFHQVYYQLERKYYDSQVMDALENDADLFKESVDSVLHYVEAISSDDIEGLLRLILKS